MKTPALILAITMLLAAGQQCRAQQKYLLASVWGVPMFQSGFGIGHLGFEYQQKNNKSAWQLSFGMAGGSIASDVDITRRKWITFDRIMTLGNKTFSEKPLFLTFFIEGGKRTASGAHRDFLKDTLINQYRAAEINPGVGIGKYVQIGKKIRMQLVAAPKLIFAFRNDQYMVRNTNNTVSYFNDRFNELRFGYRLAANFMIRL